MVTSYNSNKILSLSAINQLKKNYESFGQQDQAALQFLAVMPYTTNYDKEHALTKFIQSEVTLYDLKNGYIHVKNLLKKLKNLLYVDKSNNIIPELLNFLSIEAFKSEYLAKYLATQNRIVEYVKVERLRYKIRNAIYANNFEEFLEAKLSVPDSDFFYHLLPDFFDMPLDVTWFKGLSVNLQAALLHEIILAKTIFSAKNGCFEEIIPHFTNIRFEGGNEAIDRALALHDIFQLDCSKSKQNSLISIQDRLNYASKCLVTKSTFKMSDEIFNEAVLYFKKATKKRNFLFDLPYAIFMMLSLMATDHRKNIVLITSAIKNEQKATRATNIFRYFENILWYMQGFKSRTPNLIETNLERFYPFYSTFIVLFMFWYEPKNIKIDFLVELLEKVEVTPLLKKIVSEILWKLTDKEVYKNYLNDQKFVDVIEFTSLISFEDSWQATIDSLEGYFQNNNATIENKTKRLVWNFDVKNKEIIPLEQSLGTKGTWSKGRAIALKRLTEETFDFITSADQKIISTIAAERGWYGPAYFFNSVESVLALASHPHVYEKTSGTQLEFYVYEPELNVRQDGDHFFISLSHNSSDEDVILEKVSESRYNLVHFKKTYLPLLEIIGKGIKVPENGKDRIISVIKKIGGQIPVHSDIETHDIKLVTSDNRVIAQLTPLNFGLKVQFLVRPFSNYGPYFNVGRGRELVQIFENNKPLKTVRLISKELEIGNAIVSNSVCLQNANDGSYEWELDNPNDCLEVLNDLKQFPEDQVIIEWPHGEKFKISQTVDFNNFSLSIRQQRDWFSLDGSISFDNDTVMDLKTFMELLGKSEGNFIKLDEQKYLKLTSSLKKQLHELSILADTKNGDYRFSALSAASLKHFADQVSEVKSDDSWKELIKLFNEAEKFIPNLPSTFGADLREYQEEGFNWLSRLAFMNMGACLADDMGLGKTIQTLAVLLNKATNGPCIVVAPTSVCYNWHCEILKFAPTLTTYSLESINRAEVLNNLGKMDVLICSYTLLQKEIDIIKDKKWAMIVLDEAQAIKNSTTKRFQAAIQLEGEFKVALSGTPIENGIEEIWSIFRFIAPGLLGSKEFFQKRFLTVEKNNANASRQALKNLIKPFILRRTKNAVLQELPPKTEQTLYIEMDPEEASFYEALRQNAMENITSMGAEKAGQRKLHILAEITKLRRACCHPKLVMPVNTQSSKLKAFIELTIELLANNHKALVFSQYVGYLDLVKKELDKHNITYQYLDGSTPGSERQKRVTDFQEGKSSLFLLSLKAGGSGLNLTAADYVIHLDPWWNPAVEDQASDRIHRIGQQRPVTIYRLIMKSSIEEKILSMHHDKRALADDLLDGTNTASKLSEDDLINLLKMD